MNSDCNSLRISNDLPYEVRSARFIEYFEAYLADSLSSLDQEIRSYALDAAMAGGQRIRPLLVYHFAGHGLVSQESTIKAAVILEIVHLATLVHDDILDGAEVRRNLPSMHERLVLMGPFFWATPCLALPTNWRPNSPPPEYVRQWLKPLARPVRVKYGKLSPEE